MLGHPQPLLLSNTVACLLVVPHPPSTGLKQGAFYFADCPRGHGPNVRTVCIEVP